jgi:hypothetical protein
MLFLLMRAIAFSPAFFQVIDHVTNDETIRPTTPQVRKMWVVFELTTQPGF